MLNTAKDARAQSARVSSRELMGRPRKTPKDEPLNLSFRADADLVRDLDKEVDEMDKITGFKVSRSQMVMALLREALETRRKKRPKP